VQYCLCAFLVRSIDSPRRSINPYAYFIPISIFVVMAGLIVSVRRHHREIMRIQDFVSRTVVASAYSLVVTVIYVIIFYVDVGAWGNEFLFTNAAILLIAVDILFTSAGAVDVSMDECGRLDQTGTIVGAGSLPRSVPGLTTFFAHLGSAFGYVTADKLEASVESGPTVDDYWVALVVLTLVILLPFTLIDLRHWTNKRRLKLSQVHAENNTNEFTRL